MTTVARLLGKGQGESVEKYLTGLNATITVKVSKGAGNSRKGIHTHKENEAEMFIILSGSARMEVDGKTIPLGKGENEVDFLLTEGGTHGLFDKSEDFHCIIILLESNA